MKILEGLNSEQKRAVLQTEGPVLILAGAGSGKTRVLTHRIAYLIEEEGASPYSILALTFTNKAAREMRERVEKIVGAGSENIWVSTFHSTCVRILRRWCETIGYGRSFTIYDSDDSKNLMKDVCKYLNIDTKKIKEKTILSVISKAKDELISPEQFAVMSSGDFLQGKYAQAYTEYQKRLKANNAMDFDDLIFNTVDMFKKNQEVLERYRSRFKYIMIDEYQDTNTSQFQLIKLLAAHRNEYDIVENNLCVVGDDDQSIYKFRGANIRNILDFEKEYPDAMVIKLEQNYRSTKSILDTANEVIRNNTKRKSKALWTDNDKGTPVRFISYGSDRDEATEIINEIYNTVKSGKYNYNDFAILYRTNAQSRAFEEKLVYRSIPYKVIGSVNFYQRKEIKDMIAYLRTIDNGLDDMAVKRIINVPKRGIGLATIEKLEEYAIEHEISFYQALTQAVFIPSVSRSLRKIEGFVSFIEVMKSKIADGYELKDLVDEILEATGYIDEIRDTEEEEKAEDRINNINELINKMADYQVNNSEENGGTLAGFLEEVALMGDIDNLNEDNNIVVLMTLHSAKGLEFKNVYLVGMEEGIFPGYMSINADNPEEEIEEERRLCYVGITRAMKNLYLSAAKQRMLRGDISYNRTSRFISEIPRYLLNYSGSNGDTKGILDKNRHFDYSPIRNAQKNYIPAAVKPAQNFGDKIVAPLDYKIGDTVSHNKFGYGVVQNIVKGGRDYEVTVEFDCGVKKMLASFAKMKKID